MQLITEFCCCALDQAQVFSVLNPLLVISKFMRFIYMLHHKFFSILILNAKLKGLVNLYNCSIFNMFLQKSEYFQISSGSSPIRD
jgi:hypothetical protein